jgi:heme a synthase
MLYDLDPVGSMLLLALGLALIPLLWFWVQHRKKPAACRLRALTLITLFLTFDLVLFGAFTRLSDSGLGCPDWPGCYGSVSPLGAQEEIHAAQTAMPTGPVTHRKAWVEMIHRYAAMVVGVLITVLMGLSWWHARRREVQVAPWWATVTFLWVCLQGAFGALTVTMKLYPAIVTLHLLGGLGLLVLLVAQAQAYDPAPLQAARGLRRGLLVVGVLCILQMALGAWVSTNYAVLACTDFPTCQGQWWPPMDFQQGYQLLRPLGQTRQGGYLPFEALTAIHMGHRLGAVVVTVALIALAWRLWSQQLPALRRWAVIVLALLLWQLISGLSNVVLGWPLFAALAHTGGAAGLVVALTWMGSTHLQVCSSKPAQRM